MLTLTNPWPRSVNLLICWAKLRGTSCLFFLLISVLNLPLNLDSYAESLKFLHNILFLDLVRTNQPLFVYLLPVETGRQS